MYHHVQAENAITGTDRGKLAATPGINKKVNALIDLKNILHSKTPGKRFDTPAFDKMHAQMTRKVVLPEPFPEIPEDSLHHDHEKCEKARKSDSGLEELKLPKEIISFYSNQNNLFRFKSLYQEDRTTAMPDIEITCKFSFCAADGFHEDCLLSDGDLSAFVPPL